MTELFQIKNNNYNLRKGSKLISHNIKTVHYGTESVSYLGPRIWDQIPDEMKNCKTLNSFKQRIKSWTPTACPCNLCKRYVKNVGFI